MRSAKITIIGGGNLGSSIAKGLVDAGKKPCDITITRRQTEKLSDLKKSGIKVNSDNISAIKNADVIILCVLPQKVNEVLEEIKSSVQKNQLIISTVSGITIEEIRSRIKVKAEIVRAMPNTAIAIRESMTCIAGKNKNSEAVKTTKNIFGDLGKVIVINEDQMTSATALCACGIAFFLRAVRAASQGGIEIDFHSDEALLMAAQTAKGAAALLLHNESHPEDEIDRVTSPKGCTIAGLNQMEHAGFSSAFIKGIVTSAQKAGGLYTKNEIEK
jgi:pyrroline-5-carboxylate reductase